MTTNFVFGRWIFSLRKARRISRQQLADRSQGRISQQYIHFIETGRATNIGSDKLKALAEALDLPVALLQQVLSTGRFPQVPVVGRAAAGAAIPMQNDEYRQISDLLTYPDGETEPALFAVEVTGDSMAPRIEHGDIVLVCRQEASDPLLPGHVYLIRHSGRLTCKYLMPASSQEQTYLLVAERKDLFPDTALSASHEILGRVLEVRKTHSLVRPILS